MGPCLEHEKTLWLDVYGELPEEQRAIWERHLKGCEGCRAERERLVHLLELLREAFPPPVLPAERAAALTDSIKSRIKEKKDGGWWGKRGWGFPIKLIPPLAALCLMILAFGWFSTKDEKETYPVGTLSELKQEEQWTARDLELIKNLDLLEEMDVVQQLVKTLDHGTLHGGQPENGKI